MFMGTLEQIYSYGGGHFAITDYGVRSSPSDPDRPILIFLHGRLSTARLWAPLLKVLDVKNARCLTVDFPGFGSSLHCQLSAGDLAGALGHLVRNLVPQSARVLLVGHDTGAGVAQIFALQSPERVAAVVLLNPVCPAQSLPEIEVGYYRFQMQRRLRRIFRRCPLLPKEMHRHLRALWWNRLSRASMIQAIRAIEDTWPPAQERQHWKTLIREAEFPVLLLFGREDFLISDRDAPALAQWYRDAQYFERAGVGHWPHLEDPQWVAMKLREVIFESEGIMRQRQVRRDQKSLSR